MMIIIIPELTKPFVISTLKVQKQNTESPTHSFSDYTEQILNYGKSSCSEELRGSRIK